MKILIIDNGTIRMKELKSLMRGHDVKIIKHEHIPAENTENFDLLILSGGSGKPAILGNEEVYKYEIDLIRNSEKPIIGICLGFELIGHAYGAELIKMDEKENSIIDLQITGSHGIFKSLSNFRVYEAHRWVIRKLPADLTELAKSKNGVEVIKHKNRKLYGFQFHPEMHTETTCGKTIFNNLLDEIRLGEQQTNARKVRLIRVNKPGRKLKLHSRSAS